VAVAACPARGFGGVAMADQPRPLLEAHRFLRRGPLNAEGWSQLVAKDRDWERSYRGRWAHTRVVRSTHGGQLHGFVLVERLRQRRADHVGVAGGRLSLDRAGDAGVRAARVSAGRVVLLVRVFAAAAQVPVRARVNRPGCDGGSGVWLCGQGLVALAGSVEPRFEFGGREVAEVAVQALGVVPVHPGECCKLDLFNRLPWA
jgi:Respiratory nitrate reductase alpha N-terminal